MAMDNQLTDELRGNLRLYIHQVLERGGDANDAALRWYDFQGLNFTDKSALEISDIAIDHLIIKKSRIRVAEKSRRRTRWY